MALATMGVNAQTNNAPTMGWSSWNTYRVHISDSLICRQADLMVAKGLHRAGYTLLGIRSSSKSWSGCWVQKTLQQNDIFVHEWHRMGRFQIF